MLNSILVEQPTNVWKNIHKNVNRIAIKFATGSLLALPSKADSRVLIEKDSDTDDETIAIDGLFAGDVDGVVLNSLVAVIGF